MLYIYYILVEDLKTKAMKESNIQRNLWTFAIFVIALVVISFLMMSCSTQQDLFKPHRYDYLVIEVEEREHFKKVTCLVPGYTMDQKDKLNATWTYRTSRRDTVDVGDFKINEYRNDYGFKR